MSLKTFHIFFVTVSILLSLGFACWAFGEYRRVESAANLFRVGGALLFAIVLAWYGRWFLHKLKGVK